MALPITIAICAFNAEKTLSRAIDSALSQGVEHVLCVNDGSSDATGEILEAYAQTGQIQLLTHTHNQGIGAARNTALKAIQTPFGMWLDADDIFLGDRAQRASKALDSGYTLYVDASEVCREGSSEAYRVEVPQFIFPKAEVNPACRLFERNFFTSLLCFQTQFAQQIGFDSSMRHAEDYDFILRSVMAGARIACDTQVGYRHYAQPESLSRQLSSQQGGTRLALQKHNAEDVYRLFINSGYSDAIAEWGRILYLIQCEQFEAARAQLQNLSRVDVILEPEGPFPMPEAWRIPFHLGSLALEQGDTQSALKELETAAVVTPRADGLNNLGVAYAMAGNLEQAESCFKQALAHFSAYFDATHNLEGAKPYRITRLPLRAHASRKEYAHA